MIYRYSINCFTSFKFILDVREYGTIKITAISSHTVPVTFSHANNCHFIISVRHDWLICLNNDVILVSTLFILLFWILKDS